MEIIKTTLIDDDLLKRYSPIPLEFDIQSKMYPFVLSAQADIRRLIGEPLYAELIDQIENDALTDLNKALIVEMAPSMATLSVYYALPSLWLSITQKGVTKEQSENSQSAMKNEINYYRSDIKAQADTHMDNLVAFIENCGNYPLYQKADNKPRVGDFVYLRRRKSNNCNCGR